ncbi:hypothetical protein KAJ87_00885 [Candidatus Pacearchaeota archaeon]|nr:hypothetical protein [Candidatus Pacearchaeota archaeon]
MEFIDLGAFMQGNIPKPYKIPKKKEYDVKSATTPKDLYNLNSIKYNGEYISMKFNPYNL